MTAEERRRWDERHQRPIPVGAPGLPDRFVPFVDRFPSDGVALELACGRGETSVWLAQRGLDVLGVDISPFAIGAARELAAASGVEARCAFAVHDLDDGLPAGRPSALIVCHLFRDARLDGAIVDRLAPGGLLAIAVLSEVGSESGRYRAAPAELTDAFSALDILAADERDGDAWLLGLR
jgi:SAM-dependent methyltransferase